MAGRRAVHDAYPETVPVPFDRVASQYDATRGGPARGRQIGMDVHRWLVSGPVLEVGVGTGLIGAELFARGHPVVGLDLSAPMLTVARERLPGRVVRADALALPIPTGAVGNVVIAAVLHLVDDLRLAIAEAAPGLVRASSTTLFGLSTSSRPLQPATRAAAATAAARLEAISMRVM